MKLLKSIRRRLCAAALGLAICGLAGGGQAQAAIGQTTLPASDGDGPVTVFFATTAAEHPVPRGRFTLQLAVDAPVQRGNGRLIVMSHGSGGNPWVHSDLARALVESGYVVAFPEHRGDSTRDDHAPGPESWAQRPAEVSRAIDAVARDERFAPLLQLDQVGMYGMSAGGHTALSLAGGRWSPAGFARHCQAHIGEDFPFCVGLLSRLTGSWFDSVRKWVAQRVIGWRFADDTPQVHAEPRIAAVVAAVPAAADFDLASLAAPRVPLGLVVARQDRWLAPAFHSLALLAQCKPCEVVADMPDAGHGAMLSPLPRGFTGALADLLNDPPGFDRSRMGAVDRDIVAFFDHHLPRAALKVAAP